MDRTDIVFNNVDLLERGDDEQLQIELAEQLQGIAGGFVRALAKGLVDHYKAEGAGVGAAPLQAELVGQGRGEDGVGKFLLLATRLAGGIGVELLLDKNRPPIF